MTTLILGGGGFIGSAVARALASDGRAVVCASRHGPFGERGGIDRLYADRADPASVRAAIETRRIDTLIDMVAFTTAETERLLAAVDGALGHYVLVSSLDVYRNYGLLHRTETGKPDPGPLTETAPLRTRLYPYRADPPRAAGAKDAWLDDYDKIPVEREVRRMAAPWTILRLPMVYGPGDRQRRFRWAVEPMVAGADTIELPPAWLDWTVTYGYIDNVAAAIATVIGRRDAFRQIFNVTDADPAPHKVWLEHIAWAKGWSGHVKARDDAPFPGGSAFAALDFSADLAVSGERLRQVLGFVPPIDLKDALTCTLADEAARSSQ